jgi:mannitol/fructose-specific phosphotransferase system IIA component (Ntr-type)
MTPEELIQHFHEDFYLPDLKAKTKDEVLEELVQPLIDQGEIKGKSIVIETLNQRETLGSTGIGKGVAIPHCRTLAASKMLIVIGISKLGIPYDSIDGKKVHLFFLIVAPPQDKENLYLPILGRVVESIRNTKIRRGLIKADDFATFVEIVRKG